MGMKKEEIIEMIVKALPDAKVEVKDLAGDDNHYAATVTSSLFEGKTKVNRQHINSGICLQPDWELKYNKENFPKKITKIQNL